MESVWTRGGSLPRRITGDRIRDRQRDRIRGNDRIRGKDRRRSALSFLNLCLKALF